MGELVKKRFVIRDGDQKDYRMRSRITAFLESVNADPAVQVDIKPFKRDRSTAQNAVYWKFLTVIGGELGYSKDEMHQMVKENYLLQILERDDPDVDRLSKVMKAQGESKSFAALLSTKHLDVGQFSELIQEVEALAGRMQIGLPASDDQYREAMGARR